jgi:hypothetical protein
VTYGFTKKNAGCPEDCDPDHVSLVRYLDVNSKAGLRIPKKQFETV